MNLKRLGASALALVLALSALSGCGGKPPSASGSGSSSGDSSGGGSSQAAAMDLSQVDDPCLAVAGLAADEAVITVGDANITAADYLYWLNRVIDNYLSQFGGAMTSLPWDTEMMDGLTFGQYFLEQAADIAVFHSALRQLAQTEGLSPDPSIAPQMYDDYAEMVIRAGSDETRVIHTLWASMLTKELLTELNENSDLYVQLQELYYGENSGHYPTDAEVNAYLDVYGYFRVKHILLMTVDQETREPLGEAEIAQKKATADDLLSQLRASEDPIALFDQLMHEYSEDSGLAANPDGYIFDATDSLVGGFREATLALAVGEVSDVVETDYGYHIMLRLPIDPADYRDESVSYLLESRIDDERDRLGVTRTDAFGKLDVGSFWDNMLSLQTAVAAELAG